MAECAMAAFLPSGNEISMASSGSRGDFHRAVLQSLDEHIAILDQSGTVLFVNTAWEQFAHQNHLPHDRRARPGVSYLDLCSATPGEGDAASSDARDGISAVLAGQRERFDIEYPSRAVAGGCWFRLTVTPLAGGQPGAVLSRADI